MSMLLLAQIGMSGPAIVVICSLALLGIIGFFFVAYFAHCFLVVVIDSAAGIDEVRWPAESFTDWLTQPIYVLWVLLPVIFVPSILYAMTGAALTFGIALFLMLWLVAPMLFLSSLAAKSWMALLYGPLLKRWARFPLAYVVFLLWAGPLTALGTALLAWAVVSLKGVALAALLVPILFLLYSRVLGRYAWYLTTRRLRKPRTPKKEAEPVKGLEVESLDPWSLPDDDRTELLAETTSAGEPGTTTAGAEPTEIRAKLAPAGEDTAALEEPEDEWSPNKKPYGVMTEIQARQSWVERGGTKSTDAESYGVEDLSIGAPISLWQYYADREKKEEELREQGKAVRQFERPRKPPKLWQAMAREIFGFLLFSHTLRAWMNLCILFGVELALLNIIVEIGGLLKQ